MQVRVKVKYKYGKKTDKPSNYISSSEFIYTEAKTESAVIAALKKQYSNSSIRQEFIILEIQ